MGESQGMRLASDKVTIEQLSRQLSKSDAQRLADFVTTKIADARNRFRFFDGVDLLKIGQWWEKNPQHEGFITRDCDGDIIGFSHISLFGVPHKQHVARFGVAVAETSRGRGIGLLLTRAALRNAQLRGIQKIWLSVHADNHVAIRLYESFGFVVEGVFSDEEFVNGHYVDVLSMALQLPPNTKKGIPWAYPSWRTEEIASAIKQFQTGWLTQGQVVAELEQALAEIHKVEDAAVVNSGTSALLLAAMYSKDKKGVGRVILPDLSFVATLAPFKLLGFNELPIDVDPQTALINQVQVSRYIMPKDVLVPVNLGGALVDLGWLRQIRHDFPDVIIIEDNAQAFGSWRPFDDKAIAILSFHAAKTLSTIEGGAVLGPREVCDYIRIVRSHGEEFRVGPTYSSKYVGLNCRLTDVQAAMALSAIKGNSWILEQSRRNAYFEMYKDAGLNVQLIERGAASLAMVKFASKEMKIAVAKSLGDAKISYRPVWKPLHRQYQSTIMNGLPIADSWWTKGLLLPLSGKMTTEEVEAVIRIVQNAQSL